MFLNFHKNNVIHPMIVANHGQCDEESYVYTWTMNRGLRRSGCQSTDLTWETELWGFIIDLCDGADQPHRRSNNAGIIICHGSVTSICNKLQVSEVNLLPCSKHGIIHPQTFTPPDINQLVYWFVSTQNRFSLYIQRVNTVMH